MKKRKRDSPRRLILRIDKHNLDAECEKFDDDYGYWAKLLAKAKNRVSLAEGELKLTEAELKLSIRNNPGKYGFGSRPSDKLVEARVLTCSEYQTALAELNEAKYEKDQYEVAVKRLDHKRPMIEELCYLHNGSYFARIKTGQGRPRGVKKRGRGDGD